MSERTDRTQAVVIGRSRAWEGMIGELYCLVVTDIVIAVTCEKWMKMLPAMVGAAGRLGVAFQICALARHG